MTQIAMEDSSTERTQRIYARVAGFLFLWLIITGLAGALTRRSAIIVLVGIELMLNAANLSLVAFSRFRLDALVA